MALIVVPIWDTTENNRSWMTLKCVSSIIETVNLRLHRLVLVDNCSCPDTKVLLDHFALSIRAKINLIVNDFNLGVAKAVNKAIKLFRDDKHEHVVKVDNDCLFEDRFWTDELVECLRADPNIGVLGLKRPDLPEWPLSERFKTELVALPHDPNCKNPWPVIEKTDSTVVGTCQIYNSALLNKVGYLYQHEGLYGFEDADMCVRSRVAGFYNGFYLRSRIKHLENASEGGYEAWKRAHAGERLAKFGEICRKYQSGEIPIYRNTEGGSEREY